MSESQVIFKPLNRNAICPRRHTDGAAGYDIHTVTAGCVPACSTITLKMGFSLKIPHGMMGYLCGRSGFAFKNGINVQNSYVTNGKEVEINLINHSGDTFMFEKGTRIAQLFFPRTLDCTFEPKVSSSD